MGISKEAISNLAGNIALDIRLALARNNREKIAAVFINKFGQTEWISAQKIIQKESGFNPYARNKSSGACGIFQALPCSKLPCQLNDVVCQAKWGANYIAVRYTKPSNALSFHKVNNYY